MSNLVLNAKYARIDERGEERKSMKITVAGKGGVGDQPLDRAGIEQALQDAPIWGNIG